MFRICSASSSFSDVGSSLVGSVSRPYALSWVADPLLNIFLKRSRSVVQVCQSSDS